MSVIDSTIEIYRNPLLYVLTASTAEVHRLCLLGFLMFIVVYMASIIDLFVTLSFLLGLKKWKITGWLHSTLVNIRSHVIINVFLSYSLSRTRSYVLTNDLKLVFNQIYCSIFVFTNEYENLMNCFVSRFNVLCIIWVLPILHY